MTIEPQVRVCVWTHAGEDRYAVEITTPHQQMQVGVSPKGHRITAYPAHKTPPEHYEYAKKEKK